MPDDSDQLEIQLSARISDFAASLNQASGIASKTFDAIETRGAQASQKLDASFASVGKSSGSFTLLSKGILTAEKNAGQLVTTMKKVQDTINGTKGLALGQFAAGQQTSALALLQQVQSAGSLKAFASGAGGALGVGALVAGMVAQQTSALAALKKTADEAGVSAAQLAGLQSVLGKLGVASGDTDKLLTTFASHLVNAKANGGELATALSAAGISFTDASGAIRPTLDVLQDVVKYLRSTASEADKTKLATLALGDQLGGQFVTAVKNGGSALDNLAAATAKAGSAITNDLAAAAQSGIASLNKLYDKINVVYSRGKELAGLSLSSSDQLNVAQAHLDEARGAQRNLAVASRFRDVSPEEERAVNERLFKAAKELSDANPIPTLPGGDPRVKPKDTPVAPVASVAPKDDDDDAPKKAGRAAPTPKTDGSAEVIANLRLQLQLASAEGTARNRINDQIKLENELKRAGVTADSEQGRVIADLISKTDAATQAEKLHLAALKSQKEIVDLVGTSVESSIENIVLHGGKLNTLFKNLAESLAKAAIQAALLGTGPLGGLGGNAATTTAAGGILGGLAKLAGFADGGQISGPGSGTSDSIPAMLSHGEFVVNAAATKDNLGLLHAINNRQLPKFATGGMVAALAAPSISSGSSSGAGDVHFHNAVTVNAQGGDPKQNADLAAQVSKHVEAMINRQVVTQLRQQMRSGNTLGSIR